MVYEENGKKWVDLLSGADLRKGEFLKFAFSPESNETIEFTHAIWPPFHNACNNAGAELGDY